jgi:phospholipid/cholesterol/gamma-HCH transport system substrate-binding protein
VKTETRVGIFVIIAIGVFFYLSLNIGAIRLNQRYYYSYKTYFDDTGGVDEKAPVKIAGVEVGWVEKITLLEGGKAEVILMIHKRNKLAKNDYATVQQEGLVGTKHIDIDPGDPTTGLLPPGSALAMPGRPPTSVGDLLEQFKDIATGVQSVVESFRNTFGTRRGEENLKVALNSVAEASQRIANFSGVLERTLSRNESNINSMLQDFSTTAHHLSSAVPSIRDNFDRVSISLADDTLPYFADASRKAGGAFDSVSDTAKNMKGTFEEAEEVVEKINQGKGVLGKLINEDEMYGDLKKTVKGFKDMVQKAETIDILLDMHSEINFKTNNGKGYFEAKLRPQSDYFYNIQLVADEHGSVRKVEERYKRYDDNGCFLKTDDLTTQYEKMDQSARLETTTRIKNDILFGFQFGKRFDRVALRIGMFESTFGFGCDYYVPLHTDYFHWITTIEAFDFKGSNRIESTRPHVKWMNKFYFMRNMYTTFGFDDICSKDKATPFFGAGLRFGDEDIKYLLSYLPTKGVTGK